MGAELFCEYQAGANVAVAFREAVESAKHTFGYEGYTGSVAEKGAYVVVGGGQPMWLADATKLANKLLDENDPRIADKWGQAGAIPVISPTYDVAVTVEQAGYLEDSEEERLAVGIATKSLLKHGKDKVLSYRYTSYRTTKSSYHSPLTGGRTQIVNACYNVTVGRHDAPKVRTVTRTVKYGPLGVEDAAQKFARPKRGETADFRVVENVPTFVVKVVAGTAKAEARYVVTGVFRMHDTWETGFSTLSEARKFLSTFLKTSNNSVLANTVPTVVAVTKRSDGTPMLSATRTCLKGVATVTYTYTNILSTPTTVDGWLFFGNASS